MLFLTSQLCRRRIIHEARFFGLALPAILITSVLVTGCHHSASGPAGNQGAGGDTTTIFGSKEALTNTNIPPGAAPNVEVAKKYINDIAAGDDNALRIDESEPAFPSKPEGHPARWGKDERYPSNGSAFFDVFKAHDPVSDITVDAVRQDPKQQGAGREDWPMISRVYLTVTFADKKQADFRVEEWWKPKDKRPQIMRDNTSGGLIPDGQKQEYPFYP